MRKINKKGAEMAIGTLVIIVLAILVLVLIAFGFGTGWANLWGKMKEFFGGGVNIDSIKSACLVACQTQQTQDYCCAPRSITYLDASGAKQTKTSTNTQIVTCNSEKAILLKVDCDLTCSADACPVVVTDKCAGKTCISPQTCDPADGVCK